MSPGKVFVVVLVELVLLGWVVISAKAIENLQTRIEKLERERDEKVKP